MGHRMLTRGTRSEMSEARLGFRVVAGAVTAVAAAWLQEASAAGEPASLLLRVWAAALAQVPTRRRLQPGKPGQDASRTELTTSVWEWKGLRVDKIVFEGVTFDATDTLPQELAQKAGEPLDPQEVRASTAAVVCERAISGYLGSRGARGRWGDADLCGAARYYVGRVTIDGSEERPAVVAAGVCDEASPGRRSARRRCGGDRGGQRRCCSSRDTTSRLCRRDSEIDVCGRAGKCNLHGWNWAAGAGGAGNAGRGGYGPDAGGVSQEGKLKRATG